MEWKSASIGKTLDFLFPTIWSRVSLTRFSHFYIKMNTIFSYFTISCNLPTQNNKKKLANVFRNTNAFSNRVNDSETPAKTWRKINRIVLLFVWYKFAVFIAIVFHSLEAARANNISDWLNSVCFSLFVDRRWSNRERKAARERENRHLCRCINNWFYQFRVHVSTCTRRFPNVAHHLTTMNDEIKNQPYILCWKGAEKNNWTFPFIYLHRFDCVCFTALAII